ncbi:hypothetical protein [Tatumella citrea]|uniref:Uncharacterized protein n=1 Tax=Tatumella citrea TaxID=53336 RepID=A0A1Y0L9P2_TATCI|nr:hypothetical protein [Tatumella citrea]ARU94766.1 hypothetical protein A7K98_13965 [Tatumella citrea]ARU98804.1 hypothetical protein A7K99_13950 [Tatumella citrea]
MKGSDAIQSQIDLLHSQYSNTDRDGYFYARLSELESHHYWQKSQERQQAEAQREQQKKDQEQQQATAKAAASHARRNKLQAANMALKIINEDSAESPEQQVLKLIYRKCHLLVAKKLLLDAALGEIREIVGDELIHQYMEQSVKNISAIDAAALERKFSEIITSKGKTSNVNL